MGVQVFVDDVVPQNQLSFSVDMCPFPQRMLLIVDGDLQFSDLH